MEKYIERICNRYYALNNSDYLNGLIDKQVKDTCDEAVKGFKETLEKLDENTVITFYNLDRNIQAKVFSYDSAISTAYFAPQEIVSTIVMTVKQDIIRNGFNKIDCVMTILNMRMSWLNKLLNAKYKEVNGVGIYIGINK